ncbi:MAG: DMT family transporter [Candidatus Marsarchaeota archaeon]|nr:DMT family transporter [Candidatus Marsarchaeota archaeon]
MDTKRKGFLVLAVLVLESVFVPIALDVGGLQIGVAPLLLYSLLIASGIGALASYLDDRGRGFVELFSRKMFLPMLAAGLLGYAATMLLQGLGTVGTNPSVSAVVWRSWVIMLAILTPVMLRQKVTRKEYLGIGLGMLSVYIVMTGGTLVGINAQEAPFIAMLLLSGFAMTVSTLLMKRYSASTTGFNLLAVLASLFFMAFFVFAYHLNISVSLSNSTILSILLLGVMETGLGAILYYEAFKRLNNAFVGGAMLSVPLLTVLFSAVMVGTPFAPYYIVAAALLGAAMFVLRDQPSEAPQHITSSDVLKGLWMFDITSAFVDNKSEEINGYIRGDNRALAIKIRDGTGSNAHDMEPHADESCFIFTDKKPHPRVSEQEILFIKEMMGVENGETAVIGIGDTSQIESAFAGIYEDSTGAHFTKTEKSDNKI